jgi:phosphoserine phosphatase RsbU/P
MSVVLLSAVEPPADLHHVLTGAGFAVTDHGLGAIPPVDFGEVALAVIEVGDRPDAAAAQTRRWRAELGDDLIPIVWLLAAPDVRLAARGLELGADVVLVRPLDPALVIAQARAGARTRAAAKRLAARALESGLLGEHLKRTHADADRQAAALRRLRLAFQERSFPRYGPIGVYVSHRPRGASGGDFYEVIQVAPERVAIVVGDVIGPGAASGLLGHFVARIAGRLIGRHAGLTGEVLTSINRELLALTLDDPPLVALLIAVIDPATGALDLARAGLPAPVYLPREGSPERWSIPAPFLGTGEAGYAAHQAILLPGDRLLIGSDGIRPDGNPEPTASDRLPDCAANFRKLAGQSFSDEVARALLAEVRHEDDVTLLVVEVGACGDPSARV